MHMEGLNTHGEDHDDSKEHEKAGEYARGIRCRMEEAIAHCGDRHRDEIDAVNGDPAFYLVIVENAHHVVEKHKEGFGYAKPIVAQEVRDPCAKNEIEIRLIHSEIIG